MMLHVTFAAHGRSRRGDGGEARLAQSGGLAVEGLRFARRSKDFFGAVFDRPLVRLEDFAVVNLVGEFDQEDVKGKPGRDPAKAHLHPLHGIRPPRDGLASNLAAEQGDECRGQLAHHKGLLEQRHCESENIQSANETTPGIGFSQELNLVRGSSWIKEGFQNDFGPVGTVRM